MPVVLSPVAVYTLLWCVAALPFEALRGCMIPLDPWSVSMLLLAALAAFTPEKQTCAVLVFSARILWWLRRIPFTWDSEVLAGLTDMAFVFHLVAADAPDRNVAVLVSDVGRSIQRQMGWFYFFAGFWKINTSFLNSRFSCSSVYFAQLIDAYVPTGLISPDLAQLVISSAPVLTVVLECSIGVLMLIRAYSDSSPRCSTLAIVLAIALHIGIDITPPPNNIAAFSHEAALRYFWFAPYGVSMAVNELRALPVVGGLYAAVGASCLALTIAVQQPDVWASWTRAPVESLVSLEIHSVDWYVAAHTAFSALLLRGLCLGEAAEPAGGKPPAARASAKTKLLPRPPSPSPTPLLVHVNTALCLMWACGGVVFGVIEINSPNMFSNLRMQGGTNHLLGVPTSLLHQWRYAGYSVSDDPFSGGIVRVEHQTSRHVDEFYPAELSGVLTNGTKALLKRGGHSGRMFNSAVARVVGSFAVPARAEGALFVPFTLPAFEVRRLLRDARASGEAFEIVYTNLPGATGDERWRTGAEGRKIRLLVEPSGESCTVLVPGERGAGECQSDDLAVAPFPRRDFAVRPFEAAFGFLQSWNSLPILTTDVDELHCYGS